MAGVALPLVELGHEGDAVRLLRGDLLGPRLEEDVLVGLGQGLGVAEGDLVLAVIALPLGRLDEHPRARHPESDPAQQRLDPASAEERVVDVVQVGRGEAPVGAVPRLLVGLLEDDELELGGGVGPEAPLRETVELAPQHLAGGGGDLHALRRDHVRQAQRRVLVPGDPTQGGEIRPEYEVAVAEVPRGEGVAVHGVHVHVDGEEVVAPLGGVRHHLVQEVGGVGPLPLQAALHVGDPDEDGIDQPGLDLGGQLVEGQPPDRWSPLACRRTVSQSTSSSSASMWVNSCSMAASLASSPCTLGPVNHLRALTSQKIPE